MQAAESSPTDWEWDRVPINAPEVLHCPSDGWATGRASSYRFCRGTLPLWPEDPGGTFISYRNIRPPDVTDGLSQTASVAERLIGTTSGNDALRDPLVTPSREFNALPGDCVSANQGGPTATVVIPHAPVGSRWLSGNWLHASYYHFFPPNSAWRDCEGDGLMAGLAMMSARSHHPTGIHVGFGDGRAQLVSNAVDLAVWRAWATRAAGEVAQTDSN